MITIGLTGKARAGKSAVADILREKHGFAVIGFADTLKSMALAIDPVIPVRPTALSCHQEDEHVSGGDCVTTGHSIVTARLSQIVHASGWERAKDNYPEVRRFLQKLGTEGVRNHLGEDAWVEAWQAKVDETTWIPVPERSGQAAAGVAAPDVRFVNEAYQVRRNGAIWRITRPGDHGASAAGHASESGIPDDLVAETIENDGTLDDLANKVAALVGEYL